MTHDKKENYKILFLVIFVAILGGGVPTFSKMALEVFPIFTFIFLRFLAAALILVPCYILAKNKIARADFWPVVLISLFGMGNVVFFAFGIKQTSATVSQILYAAVPIIALITSIIILKSSVSKQKLLGVFLGLVGVIFIIVAPKMGGAQASKGSIVGNFLVFIAVISYALYTVFSKKSQEKYSPLVLTTMMVMTTLVIQAVLMSSEFSRYDSVVGNMTLRGIFALLYVGIFGTAIYFLIYQMIIKKTSPIVASMTFYLQPLFSFLWAFFLLGERLTVVLVIGSILALFGAYLVTRREE